MGKALQLIVTAEGIETEQQHQFVKDQGCDQGQGFLYGGPLTAAEIGPMLEGTAMFEKALL